MSAPAATSLPAFVGPVLEPGELATAVIAALTQLNPGIEVVDRGAYLRVQARGSCRVTRVAIEAVLGRAFVLPGDLERIMPSFAGRLRLTSAEVEWSLATPAVQP